MKRFFTLVVFCSLLIAPNLIADDLYGWGNDDNDHLGIGDTWSPTQNTTAIYWSQISCEENYSVAIKTDGTLWAWGDGTNSPIKIGNETDWKEISAGGGHTIAVKTDGTLWAWGDNTNSPIKIGNETDWKEISAGGDHNIALKNDGTLWTWGSNDYGQLGDGTTDDKLIPTKIGNSTEWRQVSAGCYHTIAVKTDGTLWAWGFNDYGQLGDGTIDDKTVPTKIGNATDWKQVSSGDYFNIAIKTDGTLWAWGSNNFGQLGTGWDSSDKLEPIKIGNSTEWRQVSAGDRHSIAIRNDGTLWAWGWNYSGQLGDGTTNRLDEPTKIENSNDWKSIAAGDRHTIAIKIDGTLWSWGNNTYGQLGDGTTSKVFSPIKIGDSNDWKQVSAGKGDGINGDGKYHTIAVKTDGTLWSWGRNWVGQLGNGTKDDKSVPTKIGNATDWKQVSAGYLYTIAIKTDGTLWAWGGNWSGQLGNGTAYGESVPTKIGNSNDWKQVSAGSNHSIAVKTDGTLWAWGNNTYGQLGDGTTDNKSVPTKIDSSNDWSSISCGYSYTIAAKTDGTLWAWGENENGQLGDGTTDNKSVPTKIGNSTFWKKVSAGYKHTIAVKTDGTLWAWGAGKLVDGTTDNKSVPTKIGNSTDWKEISVGCYHTIAVKTDGSLWAWGYNDSGQLGDGTFSDKNTPTKIDSATNWSSISAGWDYTIALKDSDSIPAPIITVTSPNGGEKYYSTDKHKIQWIYDSLSVKPVKIEFSSNKGKNWEIEEDNVTGGYYDWTVPNVESDSCLIRISDFYDSSIQDVSNNVFTIKDTIILSNNVLIIPADGTEILFPTEANKCYKISINGFYTMWERDTCYGVDAAYIYNVPKIAFDNFVWTSSLALPLWVGDDFGIILNKYRWNFRSHVGFRINGEPLPPTGFQELTHQYEIGKIYGTGNYMKFQILDSLIDTTIHKTNPIPKYNDNCGFLTVIIEEIDCGDGGEVQICNTELIYDKAPRDSIAIGIKIKAAVWENDPSNIIGKRNIISELSRDTTFRPGYRQLGIAVDNYFVPIDSIICKNYGDTTINTSKTIVGSGLVVDVSGSMDWAIGQGDNTKRIVAAKAALKKYIEGMRATDRAFLMSFSDSSDVKLDWSSDKPELIDKVNSLFPEGWTALYQSIIDGLIMVSLNDANKKALVVLSDGGNTEPKDTSELDILKDKLIQIVKQKNIPIYFVKLGYDTIDYDLFIDTVVSLSGGKTYSVYNADSLNLIYDSISVSINQDDCCSIYITYPCICDEDVNKEHYIKLFYTPSDTVTAFTTLHYKCKYPVYDCGTDVPSEFLENNKLYPNPANNNATFDFTLDYPYLVKFKIIDAMGNIVKTIEYNSIQSGEQRVNFDLSDLSSGAYLFVALFNEYALTEKFIILK